MATQQDFPEVFAMRAAMLAEQVKTGEVAPGRVQPPFHWSYAVEAMRWFEFGSGYEVVLLLDPKDEIAGFAALRAGGIINRDAELTLTAAEVYIAPRHRGRAWSVLVQGIVDVARRVNAVAIQCFVSTVNARVIALHEKYVNARTVAVAMEYRLP
jgi:hypothetical protein